MNRVNIPFLLSLFFISYQYFDIDQTDPDIIDKVKMLKYGHKISQLNPSKAKI